MNRNELTRQLAAIRETEEQMDRQPLDKKFDDLKTGKLAKWLRAQFDAQGVTAEAQTINEISKCDIFIDADYIAYKVTQVFPEISRFQVFDWIVDYIAEDEEREVEIFVSKATADQLNQV